MQRDYILNVLVTKGQLTDEQFYEIEKKNVILIFHKLVSQDVKYTI